LLIQLLFRQAHQGSLVQAAAEDRVKALEQKRGLRTLMGPTQTWNNARDDKIPSWTHSWQPQFDWSTSCLDRTSIVLANEAEPLQPEGGNLTWIAAAMVAWLTA